MTKTKGLCRNEDCELCDQIQEVEKSNFVCEKCGKPLIPFGGIKPNRFKEWAKNQGKRIVLAFIVIALIGGGIIIILNSQYGNKAPENPTGKAVDTVSTDTIATDTTNADTIETDTTEVDTIKIDTIKKSVSTQKETKKEAKKEIQKNGYGTVDLGYGTYTGDLKNGQPHGQGTIIYKKRYRIVSSKDFWANPGDKYEGEFREGRPNGSIGYWYHDGEQTGIKP